MSYLKQHPEANRAYRGRWAAAWKVMRASGAFGPEEEEEERRRVLREAAGVDSSAHLTREGYAAVMQALGRIADKKPAQPIANQWRARRIWKIERLAEEFRPENPDSYVIGVIDGMNLVRDPAKWRTALIDEHLHHLMITMDAEARRRRRKGKTATRGGRDGAAADEC